MNRSWKYFFFLLWLSYLFVCGVLLFTRGFLLSRRTLVHKSSCIENLDCGIYQKLSEEDPSIINKQLYLDCLDRDQLKLRKNPDQFTCTKSNKRVVLIVIDALRYDFARYNRSLKEEELLPFQNRLTIFDELLTTVPNNSLLFKFIANPPTTTMQRLKGLTTGSLPTFIDAGSNFATPEIDEDNILDQLLSQNKKIVFMGDDTWMGLYPRRFVRQYPYPSFNVWDLDSVDDGIMVHLKPEILKSDWSLLIAHFLGVDHCGHKYGPYHPEMTRKLGQMNDVIRDVVDTIDDDTVLFVIGDHGMTSTGDHGGESPDEITSALFIYSPVPFLSSDVAFQTEEVYQVDIVPTLSAILGFAIPFSNLGKIILKALPDEGSDAPDPLDALLVNIEKMMLYINMYSRETHAFSKEKISVLSQRFYKLKNQLESVADPESFKNFQRDSFEFLNFVRELCEEVWVQFDSFSMSRGLVLTFLLISFSFFIVEGIPRSRLLHVLEGGFLWFAYGIVFVSAGTSAVLQNYKYVEDMFLLTYVSTLTVSIFTMAIIVVQNWEEITSLFSSSHKTKDLTDVISRLIHLCSLLILFSNSFVTEEGLVLSFLLNTMVWLISFNVKNFKSEPSNPKGKGAEKVSWFGRIFNQPKFKRLILAVIFMLLVRTSFMFWRCREEQKWCVQATNPTKTQKSFKSGKGIGDLIVIISVLALFDSLIRKWLKNCGNLVGFSPTVTLVRYAPSVIVVCTGVFWVAQGVFKDAGTKLLIPWYLQLLPRVVFIFVGTAVLYLYFQPLCVYVLEKKTDVFSVYGHENIIPQLFQQVKEVMDNSESNDRSPLDNKNPVVYGLATSYSASFTALGTFVSLFFVLLLGDALSPSIVLMFAVIVLLLIILSFTRLENTLVTVELFNIPWSYVLSWGLLSSYFFYGTGHQPTFPGIHWNAAFVGTSGQIQSTLIPSILVGANTFCSQILAGLLLPMILIAPFTIYVMFSKWLTVPTSKDNKFIRDEAKVELKQGDLCLYEREGLTQYATFKLCAKYMLYHGTRIFCCMLAAAVHCRHLMVWMIFAPRFIFEGIGFFVTLGSIHLGYILMIRISTKVDQLMDNLVKKSG